MWKTISQHFQLVLIFDHLMKRTVKSERANIQSLCKMKVSTQKVFKINCLRSLNQNMKEIQR